MKRDIVGFVDKCPNLQQVKVEHHRPGACSKTQVFPLTNGNM